MISDTEDLAKLAPSQPLEVNLLQLAKKPDTAIKAYGSEWAGWCAASAIDELRRLHAENEVLMNALWKACGDDEEVVNATIESQR
jgi:hypothetical protein